MGGIALDPMGRYAALTDNLGRVILLDVPHRQMLRMWKGTWHLPVSRVREKSEQSLNNLTPCRLPGRTVRVALGRATTCFPPQQFAALGFSSLGRAGRDKPKLQLASVANARRAEPEHHRTQAGRRKYVIITSSPWPA